VDHPLVQQLVRDTTPAPEDLTNVLGLITDTMVEFRRQYRELLDITHLEMVGTLALSLARVEVGSYDLADRVSIGRDDLEEVFRMLVTEPRADRSANPGLDPDHVDAILAAVCTAVGVVRWLNADVFTVPTADLNPETNPETVDADPSATTDR
jgi:exopolyphosphatase/pppGpp-phosphohydrolase